MYKIETKPYRKAKCPLCKQECSYKRSHWSREGTEITYVCECGLEFHICFPGNNSQHKQTKLQLTCPDCKKSHKTEVLGPIMSRLIRCEVCWTFEEDILNRICGAI